MKDKLISTILYYTILYTVYMYHCISAKCLLITLTTGDTETLISHIVLYYLLGQQPSTSKWEALRAQMANFQSARQSIDNNNINLMSHCPCFI